MQGQQYETVQGWLALAVWYLEIDVRQLEGA